ncbi:hypothetical protein [Pseudomonas sp. PI1]|uniref:hypothetical protein n=1 Tax=Pseudomonas sp. PI1 TaxID=1582493 RepID=UPI00126A691E|nr:hypothetical protein [Pseudomonas sp. PI1]
MGIPFDFSRINNIYVSALNNDRQTIVFEVRNGVGVFVFMMFFSEEDESKDQLFLYLSRTQCMLQFLMYGKHTTRNPESNKFVVYIKPGDIEKIREELHIDGGRGQFNLEQFLLELNNGIPQQLELHELQRNCRRHSEAFADPLLRKVIDQGDKIYLIGPRQLAAGKKPQEKTLRKLYLHVEGEVDVLERFIRELKARNKTLAWTDKKEWANGDIRWMLNNI